MLNNGSCCQCVKDRNFESNSQLSLTLFVLLLGCCQCVKDRNFESNSQLNGISKANTPVVVSVSKIEIFKAIHNCQILFGKSTLVVVSVSKIEISKAIHNFIHL